MDDDDGDYSEVVCSDEFLNLPVDQVSKLIADDQLAVSSEEQVLQLDTLRDISPMNRFHLTIMLLSDEF